MPPLSSAVSISPHKFVYSPLKLSDAAKSERNAKLDLTKDIIDLLRGALLAGSLPQEPESEHQESQD